MIVQFKEQLGDLLRELNLPLTVLMIGVGDGTFAKQVMDWGTTRLYLVDKWEGYELDDSYLGDWFENPLLQVRDKLAIYDKRPEQYLILQGDEKETLEHIQDQSVSLVYMDQETVDRELIELSLEKLVNGGIFACKYNESGIEQLYKLIDIPRDRSGYFIKQ